MGFYSELNKKEERKIIEIIQNSINNLEDILNTELGKIIDDLYPNFTIEQRLEALVLARGIFFRG